jgi:flavin-dependent dehydrogenase
MNKETEVFVIGGGPAGLAAAIAARQKGFTVMLADGAEPSIDKACGEGLLPETLAALRDLGVKLEDGAGYMFRGVSFVDVGSKVSANFTQGYGLGVRRTVLHIALVEHAEKRGVELLWKTPVSGVTTDGVRVPWGLVRARWIIGADGSGSRVQRWIGLGAGKRHKHRHAIRRHYGVSPWSDYVEIYWGPRTQAYITPVSKEEVCVVVMGDKTFDATFERAFETWPELRKRLERAAQRSRERGAISSTYRLAAVTRKNVVLVGDASGSVDAITGDGLRLSFSHAISVAEAIELGDLGRYERAHRELARSPMWIGKAMLALGRRQLLRHQVMRGLATRPRAFTNLVTSHTAKSSVVEWITAGLRLGWQFLTEQSGAVE